MGGQQSRAWVLTYSGAFSTDAVNPRQKTRSVAAVFNHSEISKNY